MVLVGDLGIDSVKTATGTITAMYSHSLVLSTITAHLTAAGVLGYHGNLVRRHVMAAHSAGNDSVIIPHQSTVVGTVRGLGLKRKLVMNNHAQLMETGASGRDLATVVRLVGQGSCLEQGSVIPQPLKMGEKTVRAGHLTAVGVKIEGVQFMVAGRNGENFHHVPLLAVQACVLEHVPVTDHAQYSAEEIVRDLMRM